MALAEDAQVLLDDGLDIDMIYEYIDLKQEEIISQYYKIVFSDETTDEIITNDNEANSNLKHSDDIKILTDNPFFTDKGFILKEIDVLNKSTTIDRETALDIAGMYKGVEARSMAKSTTAIIVLFTDTETPVLLDSKIILKDYPVWIVTYHQITVKPRFNETILADMSIIIDSQSGEVLECFTYNAE